MPNSDLHISDQELLLAIDGELDAERTAAIYTHAAACERCNARIEAIEKTMVGFDRAYRRSFASHPSSVAASRERLRARLAEAAGESKLSLWPRGFHLSWVQCAATGAAVALLTVALSGGLLWQHFFGHGSIGLASPDPSAIPNHMLTPGAARSVSMSDVCRVADEEVVRDVPPAVREEVLHEYGISDANAKDYEIDYLIAPGLGGTDDARNLWPEPYKASKWNARVKDSLEQYLHQMVCSGNLDLATAQQDISTDWIGTYKRFFHTKKPLPVGRS